MNSYDAEIAKRNDPTEGMDERLKIPAAYVLNEHDAYENGVRMFHYMTSKLNHKFTSFATGGAMEIKEEKEKLSGHPMFYEILEEMKQIHATKNKDYGGGDPLGNFKTSAESLGVSPFKGVLVRMSDKWSRISNIVKSGETHVKDETIEDTLKDLACYCILAIIIKRETETKKDDESWMKDCTVVSTFMKFPPQKGDDDKKEKVTVLQQTGNDIDHAWFMSIEHGVDKGSRYETARKLTQYAKQRYPMDRVTQKAFLREWNNKNRPPLDEGELFKAFWESESTIKKKETVTVLPLNDDEMDRQQFRSISDGVVKGKRHDAAVWLASYLKKRHPDDFMIQKATIEAWNALNQPPLPEHELRDILESAHESSTKNV